MLYLTFLVALVRWDFDLQSDSHAVLTIESNIAVGAGNATCGTTFEIKLSRCGDMETPCIGRQCYFNVGVIEY